MCEHPENLLKLIGTRKSYTGREYLPVFKCNCNELVVIILGGDTRLASSNFTFDPSEYYPIGSYKEVKL